ncbi:MAG: filamentous hemagglutinin N-terminal domain-containing protein [Gammaproteobacteria bacterium]|nr:filamentous hemagglutinin N-terminal domain-containing protein [Gammaproteobacteria bacterium]
MLQRIEKTFLFAKNKIFFSFIIPVSVVSIVHAAPQGGVVVGGQGDITATANVTNVNQLSGSMVVDWNSFNISAQETVNFIQPSSNSSVLNNIYDQNPSQIFGSINANGQVFLSNPNGIIFGQTATVNVGALMATGLTISNDDFMNGNYLFNSDGYTPGAIINYGLLSAASGGSVTLVGGQVTNDGYIIADYGHINLATGNQAVLNFDGDGLINIQVSDDILTNLNADASSIINTGSIQANGGQILLDAHVATDVFTNAINNEGVITAHRLENVGGDVYLTGNSGTTIHSGVIDALGENGQGGTVFLLGDNVGLFGQASIDASGTTGGGTVLIGGDYQGNNPDVQNASQTYVGVNASITADAIETGNGGKVIIWGDDVTRVHGSISAQGGALSGNGGFIETSAHFLDVTDIRVNTDAAAGQVGTWLLDPTNIDVVLTVSADAVLADVDAFATTNIGTTTVATSSVDVALIDNAVANVLLQADNNINFLTSVNIAAAGVGITAQAGNNIAWGANTITTNGGAINFTANDAAGVQTGTGSITGTGALLSAGGLVSLSGVSVSTGNISTQGTSSNASTAGGAVTVTATSGLISIGDIFTTGGTDSNSSGSNGGDVTISGTGGAITIGNIGSAGGGAGGGGAAAGGNAGTILLTQNSDALLTVGNITGSGGAGSGGGASGTNAATTLNSNGGITVGSLGVVGAALGAVAIYPDANDNGTETVTFNGTVYNASSITVTGTAANADTLIGPNLSNTWAVDTSNAGTLTPVGQTQIGFSNMANLTDNGAGNFNMGTAGSVTGALSTVGGTLDYSSYGTAVNYIHGGGAGSTGITGTNSGFTTITGNSTGGITNMGATTFDLIGLTTGTAGGISYTGFTSADTTTVTGATGFDDTTLDNQGMIFASVNSVSGTGTALTGVATSFNDGTKVSGSGVDYSGLTSLATVSGSATTLNGVTVGFGDVTQISAGSNIDYSGLASLANVNGTLLALTGVATSFNDSTLVSTSGLTYTGVSSVSGGATALTGVATSFNDSTKVSASGVDYSGLTSLAAVSGSATALTGVASSFNDSSHVSGSGIDYSGLTSLATVAGDGTADVTNSATFDITSANAGTGASGLNYTAFDAASNTTTVTGVVGFDDTTKISQGITFAALSGTVTGTGAITGVTGNFNDTSGVSSASSLTYSSGFTSVAGAGGDVTGTASFALTGANAGTAASGDTYTGFNAASGATTVTGASDFNLTTKSSYGMTFAAATSVAGTGTITGTDATYNLTGANVGNDGTIFWTSFANLTDTGAGVFNMGTGGSVTGSISAVGGTVNYGSYGTAAIFDLANGTGVSTGIGGTWSGITTMAGSGNSDTIRGAVQTYTLDDAIANAGSNGTVTWTSVENLIDTGAGIFNMGLAGSVAGTFTAVGGTVNYGNYNTTVAVNLETTEATGTGGILGIDNFIGNGANSTLTGSAAGEAFVVDGINSGFIDSGAITFSGFAHLDGGNGADSIDYIDANFSNPAFSKTGGTAATGFTGTYITNDPASMTFAGMETATHAGLATFNLNLDMDVLGSSILDVSLDAAGINIIVTDDGSTTTFLTEAWANVSTLVINGGAGDNVLTLDFINGTPFNIAGGLIYNANGGSDSLILNNAAGFTDITHNFTNAIDGNINLDGATVGYTGLESITDNLAATNRIFSFAGGNETINLADINGSDGHSFIDSTLGAAVTFANPATSLTINGGSGNDTVQFNTLDALWNADITINTGDATDVDTVEVQTAMNAGAASTITINSETISGVAGAILAAGSIDLNTDSGIGTDLSPLETATQNLSFTSTLGGIYITNTMASGVTVTGTTTGVIQLSETSGDLIIGAAGINSNGGSVSLLADAMSFTGNIDAGAADVTLTTFDTTRGILIGAGASNVSTLGISDTMLSAINTSTGLIIGSASHTGGISVVGSASLASGTLNLISQSNIAINSSLTTNGTVTLQSTLGDIIFGANSTVKSTAGGIVLDANNSIAGSGALTLSAATDLTYNKPMVIDGITTITANALNLQSDITTTTGSLNLNSTDPITFNPNLSLTAAGDLNINAAATGAGDLSLNSGADINLLFALSTNGVLSIDASTGLLNIDDVLATTGGNNIIITANDIEVTGSMDSAAGTISITDAGNSIGLGFNQTGRLNITINEFVAMTGAGITLNTANDITIEGSFISTSVVPLTLNAGTITMPSATTVNLASSLDIGDSALTAASSLDIIVAETFAMNNTIETNGVFTLSAGLGVIMGAPSSITTNNQLIDITASDGDILLGLTDAGTANVNLTASAGSVLNNNGVFIDIANTLTNIIANSTTIIADDRIGTSSTDAITIDTNPAGLITLDFNAQEAYINDLNSTLIVNNGSGTVAIGLIFSGQIIGVGHNVGLNSGQTETVVNDQINTDSYISVLGADYNLSSLTEEEEDSSSLNNVVPVMIRTRDGWEFKATPRRPMNQQRQGQERKVDWL